ncbi:MAG: cell division protein FtsA [Zoogloeaceae bacterium]|jgi:cell division protein FtsA|nr:cell division protein FtsA [Zoogloeaceae bacterium]
MNKERSASRNLIVALDIGTTKIAMLMAELDSDDKLNIIGLEEQESVGIKDGAVVNIKEAVSAISRVVERVQFMAGNVAKDVYVGIAGRHIKGLPSTGQVAVRNKEVSEEDLRRVLDMAQTLRIPSDHEILHVLPQEFIIDGQGGILEPIGMSGTRLEVKAHIVTGAISAAQNLKKCVALSGLTLGEIVLQPLASSDAVLSTDEKDLGVCLLDIGGGTADLAVWKQGAIRHTAVIPIAGSEITNDIAIGLSTPTKDAEHLKCERGCALADLVAPEEYVEVPGIDERPNRRMERQILVGVIQARVEELYEKVEEELTREGFGRLSSGLVITGGAALMPGMIELGEEMLHMPVRLGAPKYTGGFSDMVCVPRFATAFGLLLRARADWQRGRRAAEVPSWRKWFKHFKNTF